MKFVIALMLFVPGMAFAYGETVLNRTINPYVPKKGTFTAQAICYKPDANAFKVYVPAHKAVTCKSYRWDHSDSHYPKKVCVGPKVVSYPAKYITASRDYVQEVCIKWNRDDSTRPRCVKSVQQTKKYPLEYTQSVYEMSDYRHERPLSTKTKTIANCY
ncbi:hypothetical protein ACLSU7_07730 [Bdellovibrio sp. HCB185ZH]|uniref:hypothetical protein n=1 Tax=Bdellovibrio sp. HCB185ZH TaxID=3394235 RepID=UPI0039A4316F